MAHGAPRVPGRPRDVRRRLRVHRTGERSLRLIAGTAIGGAGYALTVRADLGLGPWHVLQQGLGTRLGVSIGTGAILVGLVLLALSIRLRELPGAGTISAVVLTGVSLDATLPLVERPATRVARLALLLLGTAVMTFGGALLISARMGAHPLDGVMNGIYRRVPFSLSQVRIGLEVLGLGLGALAGGSVGVGTVFIGIGVGPLLQVWLTALRALPEKPPIGG